ncbi:hypothetical protein [Dactylosporangium sp. CA-233914]|uniref:hypothetical protein n=1 Tax=Dactylosporangium sp. CA-233914 TaxID=3239934 RepID=UPI003D8BF9A7
MAARPADRAAGAGCGAYLLIAAVNVTLLLVGTGAIQHWLHRFRRSRPPGRRSRYGVAVGL